MARNLYLAAYDVSDDARLRRALKVVRCHATGGQKSVHEVWLSDMEKPDLLKAMARVLDLDIDRFFLLRLDPRQRPITYGVALSPADTELFIVS